MAIKDKRGWVWNLDEKMPEGISILKRACVKVKEQLECFDHRMPHVAEEARRCAEAYISRAQPLVALWKARNRKFLPMSPDEARVAMRQLKRAEIVWINFMSSDEVQDDIYEYNRMIRAQELKERVAIRQKTSEILAEVDTPETQEYVKDYYSEFVQDALASICEALKGTVFGEEKHRSVVNRLLMVQCVRHSHFFSKWCAARLRQYLRKHPNASMHEVMHEAMMNLWRIDAIAKEAGPRVVDAHFMLGETMLRAEDTVTKDLIAWAGEG